MNSYEPSTPRAALGLVAIAMAALTVGGLVVLPAELESTTAAPHLLAAAGDGHERGGRRHDESGAH